MNGRAFIAALLLLMPGSLTLAFGASQESGQENVTETEIAIPEGTIIPIVITEYLNTRSSQVGDVFYADTTYPIWVQQRLIIPKGSTIRGTVTEVVRPGKIKGKGRLAVRFDDILLPNGVRKDLVATFRGLHGPGDESLNRKTETVTAGGSKGVDSGTIIGMGGQGAIIGAIAADGASGAVIGAGAGAAVGLATVLFTRGKDLVISPGTRFDLELIKPLKFAYNETDFTRSEIDQADREFQQVQARPARSNTEKCNTGKRGILGSIVRPFPF
jgi:type IV secretion system protein VirB10